MKPPSTHITGSQQKGIRHKRFFRADGGLLQKDALHANFDKTRGSGKDWDPTDRTRTQDLTFMQSTVNTAGNPRDMDSIYGLSQDIMVLVQNLMSFTYVALLSRINIDRSSYGTMALI